MFDSKTSIYSRFIRKSGSRKLALRKLGNSRSSSMLDMRSRSSHILIDAFLYF